MYPKLVELKEGNRVIVLKQNSKDNFIEGIIEKIISKIDNPRGNLVKLKITGELGRVTQVLRTDLEFPDYEIFAEDAHLEYKERFLVSDNEGLENPGIVPHSVFKTIAGFANAEGGKLVIGIHDNGEIIGLDRDYQVVDELNKKMNMKARNGDGFQLHFRNMLKTYFPYTHDIVDDLIESVNIKKVKNEKEICEVIVNPSWEFPIILYEKPNNIKKIEQTYRLKIIDNEEISVQSFKKIPIDTKLIYYFFVRKGNATKNYELEAFSQYWVRRLKSKFDIKLETREKMLLSQL